MTFTIHPNRLAIHAAVHRISLEVLRQIGGHDGNARSRISAFGICLDLERMTLFCARSEPPPCRGGHNDRAERAHNHNVFGGSDAGPYSTSRRLVYAASTLKEA